MCSFSFQQVKHSAEEKQHQLLKPNWNRNDDGPMFVPVQVSSSSDAHRTSTTSRKKVPLGVLVSGPCEEWNLRIDFKNIFHIKRTAIHVYENGNPGETFASEQRLKSSPVNGNYSFEREDSSDVSVLLPKLKNSDHFIQPPIEELAIKESFDPGFCSHVKDLVVGHQHYGRIKFF
ncbi:hypothetical protein AgCh_015121 [Apium graveolens]